jgi:AraC-like DNA-binding protein
LYSAGQNIQVGISLFQSVFLKIIRSENKEQKAANRSLDIAFQFRELVKKDHIEHRNVLYYAGQLNISENYLNKCVKEVTGKPPKQCINEISILHSQILLQDCSRDIAGIAFEMNYQSPSYFTHLFKKITGHSPSQYRLHIPE